MNSMLPPFPASNLYLKMIQNCGTIVFASFDSSSGVSLQLGHCQSLSQLMLFLPVQEFFRSVSTEQNLIREPLKWLRGANGKNSSIPEIYKATQFYLTNLTIHGKTTSQWLQDCMSAIVYHFLLHHIIPY